MDVLAKYDSDQLRKGMSDAVTQHGHGRLVRDDGETLDAGGSNGGGSRRANDGWSAPEWRQFLGNESHWVEVQ